MTFLTGTGRHRAQIAHFFRGQNGSWRPVGVGLVVGKLLHRIRHRCSSLVLSERSGSKLGQKMLKLRGLLREIDQKCLKRRRVRCRRLHVYSTDPRRPRETSRGRSAPERSVQFGPDGTPFPSKTSITRGPPVVAVALSSDPILPYRCLLYTSPSPRDRG